MEYTQRLKQQPFGGHSEELVHVWEHLWNSNRHIWFRARGAANQKKRAHNALKYAAAHIFAASGQCAHNLKYLTCSCSILHTVSCYTASSVFRGMLCISDSYSGAQCCAWKPLGERKVALDFPSSKTGTDPPYFGGRVYPSPDRHWQYIFASNNCF